MDNDANKSKSLSAVKLALLEIRELRKQLDDSRKQLQEPIAIVGMGCRYPGGITGPESFWQSLMDKVDAIEEIPPERWNADEYYDPDPDAPGKMVTKWGGFLKDIDQFDSDFFGISFREAVSMDPQQRLLLEVAWESLENAGIAPHSLFGSSTGVFVGIGGFDYSYLYLRGVHPESIDAYLATGGAHSVASGRLSYALGLQGPCASIDTACSSSLVAVHQAVQGLRLRECDLALAGGVNLMLTPEFHINFSKAHVLAADGRCKAFDAAADGFVRSEGCGLLVLQRLTDAIDAGHRIFAVIKGSAVNQDGRSSGLTVPNGPSQQAVIRKTLLNAGIQSSQVQYVEAHGTGTSLGDPIEVQALAAVYGDGRTKENPLLIGSVKTNLGHLETASGVAGLMKLALAVYHGVIPAHLHLKALNPHIPWHDICVKVADEITRWPAQGQSRCGGVSSFGFSGTNAHVIVAEPPLREVNDKTVQQPHNILTISGKTEEALKTQSRQYADYIAGHMDYSPTDLCFSASAGRSHFEYRRIIIGRSNQHIHDQLKSTTNSISGPNGRINPDEPVFLFTGQGAQYANMGRGIYESQPVFKEALHQCAQLLDPYLEAPLVSVLYPSSDHPSILDIDRFAQPALFAFEYAMAVLWRSWGVEPAAVIGHSLGEYVAACVAGVFSLEDATRLIGERAQLVNSLPANGMMATIFAPEAQVRDIIKPLEGNVCVSNVNSPDHIVVSGDRVAVDTLLKQCERQGIRSIPLKVTHAFHSPLVEQILDPFEVILRKVKPNPLKIPLASNLTGRLFAPGQILDAVYWRRHLREPVLFSAGVQSLFRKGYRLFIEMGPKPILCSLGSACGDDKPALWLPSVRSQADDGQDILEALGQLYVHGASIDWKNFYKPHTPEIISLPTYPFQRERCWLAVSQKSIPQIPAKGPVVQDAWVAGISAGHRQAGELPEALDHYAYPSKWRSMDLLSLALVQKILCDVGLFQRRGESRTLDSIVEKMKVLPRYRDLLLRWMTHLCGNGLLTSQDGSFISPEALKQVDLEAARARAGDDLRDLPFFQTYIERCGELLLDVITGHKSPLETLFPNGSLSMAIQIHHEWDVSKFYNNIAAAIVGAASRTIIDQKQLRILELGAGVGGLTSAVIESLPKDKVTYWCTDISEFFLAHLRERFKGIAAMRFSQLDIELAPSDQGYGSHGFDIVIAGNTLHSTRNVRKALAHARSLVSPGGILLLCETTRNLLWFDMTFGLLEMNREYDDDDRQETQRLTALQWEQALRRSGFSSTVCMPDSEAVTNNLGQHILVAQLSAELSEGERIVLEQPDGALQAVNPEVATDAISDQNTGTGQTDDFLSRFRDAPKIERHDLLINCTRGMVMRILRRDPSKPVGRDKRLMDLGIDSLMAVELRTALKEGIGLESDLPATLIFDYPTIGDIASYLLQTIQMIDGAPETPSAVAADAEKVDQLSDDPETGMLDQLNEDEMEKLLSSRLNMLEEEN